MLKSFLLLFVIINLRMDEKIETRVNVVGMPFRVSASKTEAEALQLTTSNPNVLYITTDKHTIVFNGMLLYGDVIIPDLTTVVKKTDIIDNLTTADKTKVLSANQGKLLNDTKFDKSQVTSAIENSTTKAASVKLIYDLNNQKLDKNSVVDNLTTDDAGKALSARQGKSLSDELHILDNTVQDIAALIPTKVSQLTNDSNYLTSVRVLTKDNTDVYNPTTNYHPATKKYVDDKVAAGAGSNTNFVDFDFSKVNALTSQSTAQEVKDAFVGYEKLKTDSIIRLIDISESSDWFDSSNGHVEAFYTNVDGASFSFCYIDKSNNQIVEIIANGENGNIELYRIDIIQDIPTNITKYKIINVTDGSLLTINKNLKGTEAEQHINKIFGSIHTIEDIVNDICENKSKYYIHSYNSKYNCLEMSAVYACFNGQEEYSLQFNINYYTNNGPVSKRIGMLVDSSDISTCTFYLEDILVSDNLQRVVKRTASEYESTTSKDASTMYGITE